MKFFFILFKFLFTFPNKIYLTKNINYGNKEFLIIKNDAINLISKLISDEVENVLKEVKINKLEKISLKTKEYHFMITRYFSSKVLNEIEKILKDKKFLNNISEHFGYKIKLSQFAIRYNFFNADSPVEYGPKMWNRDNDSLFNQLKMFLVLNDLTDESGGHFYFIPQRIIPSYKKIYSYYKDNENFNKNDKNSRVKNIDIEKKYNLKDNIIKYGSDKSEALILDTNETYHKGGYIKNKGSYRILLQVIYEPAYLSISNYSKLYNNFIYRFLKIFLLGLKNRLRKTI